MAVETTDPQSQIAPEPIIALARDAVAELRRSGQRRYLLGIAGAPGAGKSTLVAALVRICESELGEGHAIGLPMDGFHLTNRQLAAAGLRERKGAPETFDADGFVAALRRLADPAIPAMTWPGYSRRLHEPIEGAITIPTTAELVFVEGNYLLLEEAPWSEIGQILDSVWYLAIEMETIRARLRQRQLDGGRDAVEADLHVTGSDMANAALIEASSPLADRVVRVSADDASLVGLEDAATGRPIELDR
jgi:pantothenate kinase